MLSLEHGFQRGRHALNFDGVFHTQYLRKNYTQPIDLRCISGIHVKFLGSRHDKMEASQDSTNQQNFQKQTSYT